MQRCLNVPMLEIINATLLICIRCMPIIMRGNLNVPFKVGRPVEDEYFIDREEEIREIGEQMDSLSNACVLGIRRMGKTSLLWAATREMEDPIPVYVNCYGIPDMKRFASLLVDSVRDAYSEITGDSMYASQIGRYLKEKAGRLSYHLTEMEVSVGQYFRVRIGTREREVEPETVLEDAFRYPEVLATEKGVRFALILDEFQDIGSRWGQDFLKRLRSIAESQGRVCYLFSGSSITFMSSLIDDASSPFYRQLHRIGVGPLPEEYAKAFVADRLDRCGYSFEDGALDLIVQMTDRIPDYLQRLGAIASRMSGHIDRETVREAYEEMITELDSEFRGTLAILNQRSGVYGALLSGLSQHETLADAGKTVGQDFGGAGRQIAFLQNIGLVKKRDRGRYEIADPIFKEWLSRSMS